MTVNYFEELMNDFGGHAHKGAVFGLAAGFPYTAKLTSDGEEQAIVVTFAAEGDVKAAAALLNGRNLSNLAFSVEPDPLTGGQILLARAALPTDFYAKAEVHSVFAAVPTALEEAGVAPYGTCAVCRQAPMPDAYAFVNGACRPVHRACLQTRLDLPEDDTVTPVKVRGNYVTGIVGALLGAFIAAAPNLSTAISEGRITSALYAFIPILSALLYRLFRGKANRNYAGLVVLVSSALAVFGLELFWFWLVQSATAGHYVGLAASAREYFAVYTFGGALREMLWPILFTVVGFFPAAILLRRYAATGATGGDSIRGARYVRESAFSEKDAPQAGQALEANEDYMYNI